MLSPRKVLQTIGVLGLVYLAGCSGSGSSSGGGAGTITVSVAPTATSVVVGHTVPFTATVTGTSSTAVNWEVSGIAGGNATVGTIDASGNYAAPGVVPNPSTLVVAAVLQADTTKLGTARVQVFLSRTNQAAQALPIELGTSGGNIDDTNGRYCCGGTLGSLLIRDGNYYILSNNHVLARSDQGTPGAPISQPGLIDTNCSTSGTQTVAHLTSFVNLETAHADADAAIALIVAGAVDTSGNILSLGGTATGSAPDAGAPQRGSGSAATIGEGVAKSGRTTGLTCSMVTATDLTVSVTYTTQCNGGKTLNVPPYTNQIAISGGGFSDAGDSGSLIVDEQTANPVGLLFAGSDTETVANNVADVLTALADQQGNQPSFVGGASHQVIGCLLGAGAVAANSETRTQLTASTASLAQAQRARDLHAPELLANPYIQAVGVSPSVDRPGEAAVLLVVNAGQEPAPLPATIDGIATRILRANGEGPRGMLEHEVAQSADVFAVNALSTAEMQRARNVHGAHVSELMKLPGVQGVGITSSADAPGEAALLIYLVRGVKHATIPALIDGVRTRVRTTSRFTAGNRGKWREEGCKVPAPMPDAPSKASQREFPE